VRPLVEVDGRFRRPNADRGKRDPKKSGMKTPRSNAATGAFGADPLMARAAANAPRTLATFRQVDQRENDYRNYDQQ
jgi:hypothetical protein